MHEVIIILMAPNTRFQHPLRSSARDGRFPNCLVCETDVEIETLHTFASINAEYQLLVSHSQLVGHDYNFWTSRCSGKLFIFLSKGKKYCIIIAMFNVVCSKYIPPPNKWNMTVCEQ